MTTILSLIHILPPIPVSLGTQATVQPVLGEDTHLLLEKAQACLLYTSRCV